MWRLNWRADLTARGLTNSCGVMVNYRCGGVTGTGLSGPWALWAVGPAGSGTSVR